MQPVLLLSTVHRDLHAYNNHLFYQASPTPRTGVRDGASPVARFITLSSYLTFISSAYTIAGRSSHPAADMQLCAHSDILGTIPFNAHHLRVYWGEPERAPH